MAAVVMALLVAVISLVMIRVRGSTEAAGASDGGGEVPTTVTIPTPGIPPQPTEDAPAGAATPSATAAPEASSRPADGRTSPAATAAPDGGGSGRPRVSVTPRASQTGPQGPAVALSESEVDFGEVESTIRVDLVGTGTVPAKVRLGRTPPWLGVELKQDVVGPGERVPLVVNLDRADGPLGRIDLVVPVDVDGGSGARLRVTATNPGPSKLISVSAAPTSLYPRDCPSELGPAVTAVTVEVVNPVGVFAVKVEALYPDGRLASTSLELDEAVDDRSTWSGLIGPAQTPGTIAYTVRVTDLEGRVTEAAGSVPVLACPAG